ncbi:MAG TPA: GGDEF domain-containing protein, partial [Acidobacteriaceae bacterium]|nr:GGDEF domain-containing protein [Acidobacteriaceae bacterium]
LMFAYAVALVLVLQGFGVAKRSVPSLRGFGRLRLFIICDLSAVILLALRSRAPLLITELIPNLVLFAGVVLLYRAVSEILEIRPRLLLWAFVICAAAVPAMLWATYVHYSEIARLETHCALVVMLLGLSAATLFRENRPSLHDPAHACAWLIVAAMSVNTAWGAYGWLNPVTPNFLHPDAVHAAFSYVVMMLTLGICISLGWLSFCAHRRELELVAQTDSLTGLLNRGAFEQTLQGELHAYERDPQRISIVLLDVDHFKQVNDEHGHLTGDEILRRIAMALRAGTRPSDVLARYGGEEFVILLRDTGLEAAQEVAERLRTDIAALNDLPSDVKLTASFGVATSLSPQPASKLLSRADEALYCSKREGRNRVRVCLGANSVIAVCSAP